MILFTLNRDLDNVGKYCKVEYIGFLEKPADGRSVNFHMVIATCLIRFLLST